MEPLLETIDLDIDESNELKFKIKLEGNVSSPAKVRLVCEDEDFAYVFKGYGTNEMDVVQFTLPNMQNKLKEGLYNAKVEVLVENRYFAPLQFQINFKKSVSVVAEVVKMVSKPNVENIKITAAPIVTAKPTASNHIKFEQKPLVEAAPIIKENNKENFDEKVKNLREKYIRRIKNLQEEKNEAPSLREAYLSKFKR